MASRIFIALLPDGALRESIAALRDQWHWPGRAGPVKTLRLHVTLHFLGEMEPDPLAALTEALNVPFEPFALRLATPAISPHGMAVLEQDAVPPPLFALHASLARVLRDLDLPVDERPFRAHAPCARQARAAREWRHATRCGMRHRLAGRRLRPDVIHNQPNQPGKRLHGPAVTTGG